MQYTPLNLSPVLLEIMFKLRIFPAPLKKPAAFVKVGAAVITEAAKAPRINLREKLLFSVFSKITCSLTNNFYRITLFRAFYCTKQFNKKALIFFYFVPNPMK